LIYWFFRDTVFNMLAHRALYYHIAKENKTTCFISTGLFHEWLLRSVNYFSIFISPDEWLHSFYNTNSVVYIYIFIYFCSQVFTNIYTYKPPTLIGIGDKNAHENEMPCNAWVANYMLTNPGRKVWLCLCTSCTLWLI